MLKVLKVVKYITKCIEYTSMCYILRANKGKPIKLNVM
jgi:hypothetical protein